MTRTPASTTSAFAHGDRQHFPFLTVWRAVPIHCSARFTASIFDRSGSAPKGAQYCPSGPVSHCHGTLAGADHPCSSGHLTSTSIFLLFRIFIHLPVLFIPREDYTCIINSSFNLHTMSCMILPYTRYITMNRFINRSMSPKICLPCVPTAFLRSWIGVSLEEHRHGTSCINLICQRVLNVTFVSQTYNQCVSKRQCHHCHYLHFLHDLYTDTSYLQIRDGYESMWRPIKDSPHV